MLGGGYREALPLLGEAMEKPSPMLTGLYNSRAALESSLTALQCRAEDFPMTHQFYFE